MAERLRWDMPAPRLGAPRRFGAARPFGAARRLVAAPRFGAALRLGAARLALDFPVAARADRPRLLLLALLFARLLVFALVAIGFSHLINDMFEVDAYAATFPA